LAGEAHYYLLVININLATVKNISSEQTANHWL